MCVSSDSVGYLKHMFVFFQAEDGIRYLVRSRGLGDVYKRQMLCLSVDVLAQGSPGEFAQEAVYVQDDSRSLKILSLIHI